MAEGAHGRALLAAGGTSALALQVELLRRGVDLLKGLGAKRIAATGASGGAVQSFWLALSDERVAGASGVFAYDPLRLTIDVRGTHASGYELARLMREQDDVNVELAGENVVVAVFGMGEDAGATGERLVTALHRAVETLSDEQRDPAAEVFAPPPPWGELAMTPREAFLSTQEVVPVASAVGRVAAESLAAYPPGVPNVLPGERLTEGTLAYIRDSLDHGGQVRGASDRTLRTIRVVREA